MWFLTSALALGPSEVDDRLRSIDALSLAPDLYRRVEEPLTLTDGAFTVTVKEGVMVPVFSGRFAGEWDRKASELLRKLRQQDKDATLPSAEQRGSRELVGFVLLDGDASVTVDLGQRSDAMVFANRGVMIGGADKDAMAAIASKSKPYTTHADQGLFLSADPLIDTLFLGDPDGDPYEIIVYEDPGDLGGATTLLKSRLEMWRDAGVDWENRIAWDRVTAELGHTTTPALLVDIATDDRLHLVANGPTGAAADRWIAQVRDDAGLWSTRWRSRVFAAGRAGDGSPVLARISGEPFPAVDPEDPTSQRLPPDTLERTDAESRVLVELTKNGLELAVQAQTRITLTATAPTAMVDLKLPRVEAVPETFELASVMIDGHEAVDPDQIGRNASRVVKKVKIKDGEGKETTVEEIDGSNVRVVFPKTLAAGESIDVVMTWTDTWPYANIAAICGREARSTGTSSGAQRFLPEVAGTTGGGPWNYTMTVGVPADSKLKAIGSGKTKETIEKDGWRLSTTDRTTNARWPSIVVGDFQSLSDPAQKGMPAVNAHLLTAYPGQLEQMAPEARRVVSYLQGWLPAYPVEEIDVVEGPADCEQFVWTAPHGMATLQRMWTPAKTGEADSSTPKLAHSVYAHEIAHQYWGQVAQPASLDDRWMVETFAEVYSCMYVAAAFKNEKLCTVRMKNKRNLVEVAIADPRSTFSLSEAFHGPRKNAAVYSYGPYVMVEMLRTRIGVEAFFAGLDVMLRDHPGEPLTQERLQTYLEASSGQDLADFFAFWVDQGIVPSVKHEVVREKGAVRIDVTSDVPFGTFDLAVRVSEKKLTEMHQLTVVNGKGSLTVPGFKKPVVKLDPEDRTLLRR